MNVDVPKWLRKLGIRPNWDNVFEYSFLTHLDVVIASINKTSQFMISTIYQSLHTSVAFYGAGILGKCFEGPVLAYCPRVKYRIQ